MSTNAELQRRQAAACAPGAAARGKFVARAENAIIHDVEGRRFIDLTAGIGALNTGHRHPKVMAAAAKQIEAFTHTCFGVAPYESYIALAERLNAIVDTGEENLSLFLTTGAEAVENAVKIARAYTQRPAIVAFAGGFHGRTFMAMALTGKVAPYKKNFGPFPGDVFHAPFPQPYHGISEADAIAGIERLFAADVDPARVAAIVVEAVQGEGGFNVAPFGFLKQLRALADAHGIVLVVDEIQSGIARTGKMLAIEHAGVKPDLVTLAKGLAGGFPLSAVVGKARIVAAAQPGGLGGTYAGSPVGIAAAHAVLDVVDEEQLVARAAKIGASLQGRLKSLAARQGMERLGDVRGLGAMTAVEFVEDPATRAPSPQLANRVVAEAEKRGLIVLSCGTRGNVVRFLPPLTIEEATLEEALQIFERAVEAALAAHVVAAA
jgi:4-aminobutyrate aminotransferase/(S)-3-amino-2-methylpropionate transaminase